MTTPQALALQKFKEVIELAKNLYAVDLSKVIVRFDLKGRVAGTAGVRGSRFDTANRTYTMRINNDLLKRELNDMLTNVIPHEAAHLVCFMNPQLGANHDYGWAQVCRQLGGNGSRTHSMEVVYGTGNTYEYTSKAGKTLRLSQQRHNAIQRGRSYSFQRGIGVVDRTCAYTIVGCQGRTLAAPVQGRTPAPNATVADARVSFNIGAPERPPAPAPVPVANIGTSKADVARMLMTAGHARGDSVETIIMAIMTANKHPYALAKSYYQNNAVKMGYPAI